MASKRQEAERRLWKRREREARRELTDFEKQSFKAAIRRLLAITDEEWQEAVDENAGTEGA